jgi:hypothetical protein
VKLLLDECLPEELKDLIIGHEVLAVSDMKWKGITNGELMKRAGESGFDVFLTSDKNIRYQQNIGKYPLAVIIFDVVRNTVPEIKPKLAKLNEMISYAEKANYYLC